MNLITFCVFVLHEAGTLLTLVVVLRKISTSIIIKLTHGWDSIQHLSHRQYQCANPCGKIGNSENWKDFNLWIFGSIIHVYFDDIWHYHNSIILKSIGILWSYITHKTGFILTLWSLVITYSNIDPDQRRFRSKVQRLRLWKMLVQEYVKKQRIFKK